MENDHPDVAVSHWPEAVPRNGHSLCLTPNLARIWLATDGGPELLKAWSRVIVYDLADGADMTAIVQAIRAADDGIEIKVVDSIIDVKTYGGGVGGGKTFGDQVREFHRAAQQRVYDLIMRGPPAELKNVTPLEESPPARPWATPNRKRFKRSQRKR